MLPQRQPRHIVKFFEPSQDPAEGLGVLMLFRLIEESVPAFFSSARPILITRAPGRLAVIGGRWPGRGSLRLQMPIAEGACVAVQQSDDDLVRLWSPCRDGSRTQLLSMRLADLGLPDAPIDYQEARALLLSDPRDRWAGYLLGALLVLARERGLRPTRGSDLLLYSDVPDSRGVAASTAITLAAMRAFALQHGVELAPGELVELVDIVEREVFRVGDRRADAMALLHAEAGELLVWRDGADDLGRLVVPSDLEFVALETGPPPAGLLASVAAQLTSPSTDDSTAARFASLLGAEPTAANRRELGDLLFAAHADYAGTGEFGTPADVVVAAARARRDAGGALLGAKATGPLGTTVVLLGPHTKVWHEALRLKKALHTATGHSAHVFRWSSPGALAFGSIELRPRAAP